MILYKFLCIYFAFHFEIFCIKCEDEDSYSYSGSKVQASFKHSLKRSTGIVFDSLKEIEGSKMSHLEECNKTNELFKVNESCLETIEDFASKFDPMMKAMENLPNNQNKMDAIYFIGMTGSGKSTLVQILGGDNFKIYSKKITKGEENDEKNSEEEEEEETEDENEGSGKYIIVDSHDKIGGETVVSKTLYPEILFDSETGYILIDNPGFEDTRSPVHELVTLYSMKKALQRTGRIKIAIVETYASLQTGIYRENFVRLLKNVAGFLHNIRKFEKSIYLIGTKAENSAYLKNGKYTLSSDKTLIKNVAEFLKSILPEFSDRSIMKATTDENNSLNFNSLEITKILLEKYGKSSYSRIKILRTPMKEGPIASIPELQTERQKIRNMLLNNRNFVETDINDFGFTLSAEAKIYLGKLFKNFNLFVSEVSKVITLYFLNRYETLIRSVSIDEGLKMYNDFKIDFKLLTNEIGLSESGTHFVKIMNDFSKNNNLTIYCFDSFENILKFDALLSGLEGTNNVINAKYDPLSWNATMNIADDIIENKIEEYNLLNEAIEILSLYEHQKNRKLLAFRNTNDSDIETNVKTFLGNNTFKTDYNRTKIDRIFIDKFELLLNVLLKHEIEYECGYDTLVIKSYNILLSELDEAFNNCRDTKRIVILARNILFIDKDLTGDRFKSKDLIMIAPIWNVIGKRAIDVSGINGQQTPSQAPYGTIGIDGYNGEDAGNVFGIGMNFNNGINLLIKANGGDGSKGQDGGDGQQGIDGVDGFHPSEKLDNSLLVTVIFNSVTDVYIERGSTGTAGGNSGVGGKGGSGGKRGSVIIYSTKPIDSEVSIETSDGKVGQNGLDGKPGKGGKMGCDVIRKEKLKFVLSIPVYQSEPKEFVQCERFNPDGIVEGATGSRDAKIRYPKKEVCVDISNYEEYFRNTLTLKIKNNIVLSFIDRLNKLKYKPFCF
ncbi:uncharacterized protein LOC142331672 [Lycorma delicatula]|uniref:uncharacterized protein LOC142331672 n=1 Tax=Lycorma delicatula TaxID=130591 RepID=UPI003F50D643